MPRKAMPKVPRKIDKKTLTDKQERFAMHYVQSFDRVEAARSAGYEAATPEALAVTACRLLKNVNVQRLIEDEKLRVISKLKVGAEFTLLRMHLVYVEAMREKNYQAAIAALDKIAKHYGLYEKHNTQRKYTQDDVEKLREKLEQHGVSFERVNYRSDN